MTTSPQVIESNGTQTTIVKMMKTFNKSVFGLIRIQGECPDFGFANKEWDITTDFKDGVAYFYNKNSFNLSADILDFTPHNKWRSSKHHFKMEFPEDLIRTYDKEVWDIKKIDCAFGYCCERLYNRGCLEDWENKWNCGFCKNEISKITPSHTLSKKIGKLSTNYGVMNGGVKCSNIFGSDELIPLKDFKENMCVPIMPLRCLCGCSHIYHFTEEEQNKRFKRYGKYKLFFSPDHIKTFKAKHHF